MYIYSAFENNRKLNVITLSFFTLFVPHKAKHRAKSHPHRALLFLISHCYLWAVVRSVCSCVPCTSCAYSYGRMISLKMIAFSQYCAVASKLDAPQRVHDVLVIFGKIASLYRLKQVLHASSITRTTSVFNYARLVSIPVIKTQWSLLGASRRLRLQSVAACRCQTNKMVHRPRTDVTLPKRKWCHKIYCCLFMGLPFRFSTNNRGRDR